MDPLSNRWEKEKEFFDAQALKSVNKDLTIDPFVIDRYSSINVPPCFSKELLILLAGDLSSKRILDLGCGEGADSVLLAKLGANVVGIDISDNSIDVAVRRAKINGVEDKVRFICTAVQDLDIAESFDIIWCNAILHHLIPVLPDVLKYAVAHMKEEGVILIKEPVVLNKTLRKIRLLLPINTEATPGERPLEISELLIIDRVFKHSKHYYFTIIGRINKFILSGRSLERSPWYVSAVIKYIAYIDRFLLRMQFFRKFASEVVISGKPH